MIKRIARLIRGSKPTLLDTEKANELIDAINSMQNVTLIQGAETRASVTNNGINLTIKKEKPVEIPNLNITAEPPLMVKQLDKYKFKFWLEGYTQNIKYCGGEGNLLHLAEDYNSNDIDPENIENVTIASSVSVTGTPQP